MEQLELRFYPREEIAKVLNVNIRDSNHFADNVKRKLTNSGYGFDYHQKQGVIIRSKPEAPAERLAEILYRGFGINIQVFPEQFAFFIAAFNDIPGFDSMPWVERAAVYYQHYGVYVSDKTLRNWCSQLIDRGVIAKWGGSTKWRTYFEGDRKIREPIEEIDEVEMQNYFERRSEIFKDNYITHLERKEQPREARELAWKDTYTDLWAEFGCCYYYCKNFTLSAFPYNGVDVREIIELSRELAAAALPTFTPSLPPPQSCNDFVF